MDGQKLLEMLVKANEFKEGDLLVGGTRDERERQEARRALSHLPLGEIAGCRLVEDGVSEVLERSPDRLPARGIARMTVGGLKEVLLGPGVEEWVRRFGDGLTSEQIAAVVKVMADEDLSSVSRKIFNPLPGEGTAVGSRGHFGSRIQPNSPGDDEEEILFSILEGLSYGCGDVVLGVNPAGDDVETIIRLEQLLHRVKERLALPVRFCVLSDMVKQSAAKERTPVDVGFQSLAGTSKGLQGMLGLDVDGLLELAKGFNGLYFETGQGSAVTNHAAEGVDMVTLESRNYGLARHIRRQTGAWTIVNDVAGFIGPEVFRSPGQLLRACLEDTVMAKLHGLTMGLDVCSTFHMGIDPATLRRLTWDALRLAEPAYLMAVAGNADPMLGYLTTSFREHPQLRRGSGKRVCAAMRGRLAELGIMTPSGDLAPGRPGAPSLYALYARGGGDTRSMDALAAEGRRKLTAIRERGFDLGYGDDGEETGYQPPHEVRSRLDAIYRQARRALYSAIDEAVIRDVSPRNLRVRTPASDREDYLSHPAHGETILKEDHASVAGLYGGTGRRPRVQIVVSDGLNADAVNENLRAVLPALKRSIASGGCHAGETDIVVKNGRVRAGYHIGELLDVEVVVHLIGERPGTGLNTLSAYLTYGRDAEGRSRWSPSMDHSATTAVCGINRLGRHPAEAAEEIASLVIRILRERRSGTGKSTVPL